MTIKKGSSARNANDITTPAIEPANKIPGMIFVVPGNIKVRETNTRHKISEIAPSKGMPFISFGSSRRLKALIVICFRSQSQRYP